MTDEVPETLTTRCKLCGDTFTDVQAYDSHVMDHMHKALTENHPTIAAAMRQPTVTAFNHQDPAHWQILTTGLIQLAPEILQIVFALTGLLSPPNLPQTEQP